MGAPCQRPDGVPAQAGPRDRDSRKLAGPAGEPRAASHRSVDAASLRSARGLGNERAGAFTQAFGSEDLDASALMLVIAGFLPGDDPRMKATIDAVARRLTDQRGLVYR